MARDKGKSQRRIRDWHNRDGDDMPASRRKFSERAVKLPADRIASTDNLDSLPRVEGMVSGLFPGGATVLCNGKRMLCGIAGTFRAPASSSALAVGDIVTIATSTDGHDGDVSSDLNRADGMILQRADRKTVLARPAPRSNKHRDEYDEETVKVIVANMDALLIVAATRAPRLNPALIDRFMIIAERGGLAPMLVINKIDLGDVEPQTLADLQSLGMAVFLCSAAGNTGIDPLREAISGKRCVLAGASGVGKSSLINALIPSAGAVTGEIRQKDMRGRHTTASAMIYDSPGGGIIVDTPGVRELGVGLQAEELAWYFPQFAPFVSQCKFNNCTHTHEPVCGVRKAAEENLINPRRYESYLKILATINDQ